MKPLKNFSVFMVLIAELERTGKVVIAQLVALYLTTFIQGNLMK